MSFPVSPTNGQQSTIANIVYQYASATNAWTVVPGYANTISATGNIAASYFFGNGSQLTGVVATGVTSLSYGTTTLGITSSGGNANATIGGTSNVVVWANTGEYVSGIVSATGNITASGNISGNFLLGNAFYVSGLSPTRIYSGTSNVSVTTTNGNISVGVGGTSNVVVWATTGQYVTGVMAVSGNINTTGANGVANIGAVGAYFNTVHAKATSAQYADVAEIYVSDDAYVPGTVLNFGGNKEVTETISSHSTAIAGVVSTDPAYIMNAGAQGEFTVEVALLGRVPCKVIGQVRKGDRLVSSDIPGVAQSLETDKYNPGCIIGKSLEDYDSNQVGFIEVVVGRV